MTTPSPYTIHNDVAFGFLSLIDVDKIRQSVTDDWFNQTLCQVNDCVVRLGVVQGEFHWHKHDNEDEMFYVVEGRLIIDLEGDTSVDLGPTQGVVVPAGMLHRPRAIERTVVLMVERDSVTPTGD
jgi:mannose-6-phosphate isomerase-like protein (cupin superfamily)